MNPRIAPLNSNKLKYPAIRDKIIMRIKEVMPIPEIVCNDCLCPLGLFKSLEMGNSNPLNKYEIPKTCLKYTYEPIFSESESGSIEPSTNKNNAPINQVNPKNATIELIIGIWNDKETIINITKNIANPSAMCSCSLPFIIITG